MTALLLSICTLQCLGSPNDGDDDSQEGNDQCDDKRIVIGTIEAERIWRESLRIATEIHGTPVALDAVLGLASLRAKKGDMQSALELLLTVLNHPASVQETKNRAEQRMH